MLILRRIVHHEGYVAGWWTAGPADDQQRQSPLLSIAITVGAVVFYILFVKTLGFLITMPLLLFCTIWWFDRRLFRAAITAVIATWAIHSFFYQLMSVQLPWGIMTRYAGTLTW